MALFKIYRGKESLLPLSRHEGYMYFTTDEGNLYVDIDNETRVQINALAAQKLIKEKNGPVSEGEDPFEYIEFDEFFTTSDIVPVENGGTGALNATGARNNLSVYSKTEVDDKITAVTTKAYTATLAVANWVQDGQKFRYDYANTNITCGSNGSVPPIISYTSNLDEYSLIESADATPGTGIVFIASKKPTAAIGIVIVDNK